MSSPAKISRPSMRIRSYQKLDFKTKGFKLDSVYESSARKINLSEEPQMKVKTHAKKSVTSPCQQNIPVNPRDFIVNFKEPDIDFVNGSTKELDEVYNQFKDLVNLKLDHTSYGAVRKQSIQKNNRKIQSQKPNPRQRSDKFN